MRAESVVYAALAALGEPVANSVYQGKAETYIVFAVNTVPADFGDDAPGHERHLVQAHLYAPIKTNMTGRVLSAQRALCAAGCTWPEVVNADDESGRHRVLECEIALGVDVDGDDLD